MDISQEKPVNSYSKFQMIIRIKIKKIFIKFLICDSVLRDSYVLLYHLKQLYIVAAIIITLLQKDR